MFGRKKVFINKAIILFLILANHFIFTSCGISSGDKNSKSNNSVVEISKIDAMPEGAWQALAKFPDWAGYVDDTLAMNSMYSYDGYRDQGELYITVGDRVTGFDFFINNTRVDTEEISGGTYRLDVSKLSLDGTNTIQVSNIEVENGDDADGAGKVTVAIPYPTVIEGTPEEVGIDTAPLELIDKIITADMKQGYPGAQLAIIKDGKLIYQNSWGTTNDTMYDLASNTKMYSVVYAIQYLVEQEQITLDEKVVDIIGNDFVDKTIEIKFASFGDNPGEGYPGLDKIKEWKSGITVKNLLMHQAGLPDSGHYHNQKFDQINQSLSNEVDNVLFIADSNKEKALEGICRTPLIHEPGTKVYYSDIDYMLLGIIIEKKTGKDLNTLLKETFWEPMGLTRITYNPLENGYTKEDCAPTEIKGNTRDGLIDFPGIRKDMIQGEVHDEECYYIMEGMSGHAGLFANATDLAKLASVMLTGGYGNNSFFSMRTRDLFISPQAGGAYNYGIGWFRKADHKRAWYFGNKSPESTVGHQGWTGTLTMIDFENNLVMVYLSNSINTPLLDASKLENANTFSGGYYTSATLGFVSQILYTGIDNQGEDLDKALDSLVESMVQDKERLVEEITEASGEPLTEDHPAVKALEALKEVAGK